MLILIIGVGFFLKYAFDQEWIGPAVQISLGFICGLRLLAFGNIMPSAKSSRLGCWFCSCWPWNALSFKLFGYAGSPFAARQHGAGADFLTTAVGASLAVCGLRKGWQFSRSLAVILRRCCSPPAQSIPGFFSVTF